MSGVFISYRRDDSSGYAGRLYDRLQEHFSSSRLFMDIDTLNPGTDYSEVIEQAVRSCDVCIALIGRQWLTCLDDQGRRRLDDPEDFVRREIAAALTQRRLVIPVLIQGAKPPLHTDLPGELKRLSRLQALDLTDKHFNNDVAKLISYLEQNIKTTVIQESVSPSKPQPPTAKPPVTAPSLFRLPALSPRLIFAVSGSILMGGLLLVAFLSGLFSSPDQPVKPLPRPQVNVLTEPTKSSPPKSQASISISTHPVGFHVYQGNELLGTTPFETQAQVGSRFKATLKQKNYEDKSIVFIVNEFGNDYSYMPNRIRK